MVTVEKIKLPQSIEERVQQFVNALEEDHFFDDPINFPPKTKDNAKSHLWNYVGEILVTKFIEGSEETSITEDEMEAILTKTIIQTNLDSLMGEKLIDGIENERGEMVYWVTDKGKEVYKRDLE